MIGVLPQVGGGSEIAHQGLTRLEVVPTRHQRKGRRMVKLADAFLMLPGGYGTLDEMMEIVRPEDAKPLHPDQHGNLMGWFGHKSGLRG